MRKFWRKPSSDHLNDYWNVAWAGTLADASASNAFAAPALMDTIDRIHGLYHPDRLDGARVSALEQRLMDAFVTAPAALAAQPTRSTAADWLTPGRSIPTSRKVASKPSRIAAALAVAVVVAITFYSLWPTDNQPAIIAPQATSTTAVTPEESAPPVTMYRGNAARTGEMPGPGPEGVPGVLWRAQAGDSTQAAVTYANGRVFIGSQDGTVHAFAADSGAELWTFPTEPMDDGPYTIVDGDTIYTIGGDGLAYALNAETGTEIWHSDESRLLGTRPVFGDGVLYAPAFGEAYAGTDRTSHFYAINASDGSLIWEAELGAVPTSRANLWVDGTIFTGADDGSLYAINAADGTVLWNAPTGYESLGSLAYANGTVFGQASSGSAGITSVVAMSATDGAVVWKLADSEAGYSPPSIYGNSVLVGTGDGLALSVAQADGSIEWTFESGEGDQFGGPPSIVGDIAYFISFGRLIYAIDATSGAEQWRVIVDAEINMSPAITGGVMYVATWSGSVYALGDGGTTIEATPSSPVSSSPVAGGLTTPGTHTEPATLAWETSGGEGGFSGPTTVTIAPDGNIWVTDSKHDLFQIFAPDGTYLDSFGSSGKGNGAFKLTRPDDDGFANVAFADDGSFVVLDAGNRLVQVFDKDRSFVTQWGGAGEGPGLFLDPVTVAIDADGNINVLDGQRADIQIFSMEGELLQTIKLKTTNTGYGSTCSMTIGSDGNFYIAECAGDSPTQRIVEIVDATGAVIATLGDTEGPGAFGGYPVNVALDASGNTFVTVDTDGPRVVVFAPDGTYLTTIGAAGSLDTPMSSPWGIALDNQGSMYVVDWIGNRLIRFQLNPPLWPLDTDATPAP